MTRPKNLPAWLSYIESLHPKSIAMGLARVQRVIAQLKLQPKFTVITVAGTNGKGSTCAMLAQIYQNAGFRVGSYSSPHLLHYNERVCVNGKTASDDALCQAFEAVEAARIQADETPLTYFEVGTLAAVWHFIQADVEAAILEIGLGGRLDAVNAFTPHCAIVTAVDLDHQEFLGDTREKIGLEKAGVYRQGVPAICGDDNPPQSLVNYAHQIAANLQLMHRDFSWQKTESGWNYCLKGQVVYHLPLPALQGCYQLNNAACAITAVEMLQNRLAVKEDAIAQAMLQVMVMGRFQVISHQPFIALDVAHNPHAAFALVQNIKSIKTPLGKTIAVFAMLADKDTQGVIDAVMPEIDVWYVASIDHVRGALATELVAKITQSSATAKLKSFDSVAEAYLQACEEASENDRIIVFGSFFTVASVLQCLNEAKTSSLGKT
ncbi:MAG: bifunctional tetrahydrofolate synthase/dihydrofolate synthase [Methylotenera sp.]|nr:bifunctional tetrahydrofolate synthase/dihydrofolate synthase [Methylotenera sp.]